MRRRHFLFILKASCAIITIEFFDVLEITLKIKRRGKMAICQKLNCGIEDVLGILPDSRHQLQLDQVYLVRGCSNENES